MLRRAFALALLAALLFTLQARALTILTAAISFPGVTLNGADQVLSGSTTAWRADATGEAGGWNLTVASSDFVNGAAQSIPVANFEIRLPDANIVLVSGDVNKPTSTQAAFAALSGTALKIASAAVGAGNGIYDLTPEFRLTVPAESYAGSYSATVTVAVSIGP